MVEEDLTSKLKEVEMAHVNSKHGQSWRLINDISGRKASAKGQLKGDTQKERVKNWFNHFKNLLGRAPSTLMMKKKKLHLYWKNLISRRNHLIRKSMNSRQRNHCWKGRAAEKMVYHLRF